MIQSHQWAQAIDKMHLNIITLGTQITMTQIMPTVWNYILETWKQNQESALAS